MSDDSPLRILPPDTVKVMLLDCLPLVFWFGVFIIDRAGRQNMVEKEDGSRMLEVIPSFQVK